MPTYQRLRIAYLAKDSFLVYSEVEIFRLYRSPPLLQEFKMAMKALLAVCGQRTPTHLVIALYSDLALHNFTPDREIYDHLLAAFCYRDCKVNQQRIQHPQTMSWLHTLGSKGPGDQGIWYIRDKVLQLLKEQNYTFALLVFDILASEWPTRSLSHQNYTCLLLACANHGDATSASQIFVHMEESWSKLIPLTIFCYLL